MYAVLYTHTDTGFQGLYLTVHATYQLAWEAILSKQKSDVNLNIVDRTYEVVIITRE